MKYMVTHEFTMEQTVVVEAGSKKEAIENARNGDSGYYDMQSAEVVPGTSRKYRATELDL